MNTNSNIELSELKNTTEAALAAKWLYEEWARFEAPAMWQANQADIAQSLDATVSIPKFFAYRVDGKMVGMASIVPHDLPDRAESGPWLSNVRVLPECRGQGVGRALVRHVMDYASALTPTLYLYTFDHAGLYEQLGWTVTRHARYVDRPITVMQCDTASTD